MPQEMDVKVCLLVMACFMTAVLSARNDCPTLCKCSKNFKVVNCEHKRLEKIPDGIPDTVTELYLGNNLLTGIPDSVFEHLSSLQILSLKNNMLLSDQIHNAAFSGLHQLKYLFLTGNNLDSVSRELFNDTGNLQRLYFSQNKLTVIPDLGLCTNLVKLGVDNNKLSNAFFPEGFLKLYKLSTVVLSNNVITSFTHADVQHLEASNIRKIDLSRCLLKTVDTLAFTMFPHLQSLTLSYNQFLTMPSISNIINALSKSQLASLDLSYSVQGQISPTLFANFSMVPLTSLALSHMRDANVIENGTFSPLKDLQKLDLSYSKLTLIENGAFDPRSSKLQQLKLESNDLKIIPENLPMSLQVLDMSNNGAISTIGNKPFIGLNNLRNLTFKNCRIQYVDNDAFVGTFKLSNLDLSHNMISGTTLGVNVLKPLINLKVLTLKGNKMTQIITESRLFEQLNVLEELDMSDNNCEILPQLVFNPLKSLNKLDLSGNNLGTIIANDNGKLFSGLAKLEYLDIHNSGLVALPRDLLKGTGNLRHVMLSLNRISQWGSGLFNETQDVTLIDLSRNSIAVINSSSVQGFPYGVWLNLSGNPFNCWCDLIWFRQWVDKIKNSSEVILLGVDNYTCLSPKSMLNKKVLDFHPEAIHSQCFPPPWMYYVIGAGVGAAAILLIVFGVIYRYRWPLRLKLYYLQKSCRRQKGRAGYDALDGNDMDIQYDVLVSYGPSDRDQDWVKKVLIPNINDLKVFFEDGNAMPNECVIGQIAESIWNSRKILLIVSKNYIQNSRRYYEIQLALSSLEERELPMSESIILVLLDEAMDVTVPPLLHPLMDKHRQLVWTEDQAGQDLFWNTLRERIMGQPAHPQHLQV